MFMPRNAFAMHPLREAEAAGAILGLQGEFRFLSNFWRAPVLAYGILFPTVEHAFQLSKLDPKVPGAIALVREIARFARGEVYASELPRSLLDELDPRLHETHARLSLLLKAPGTRLDQPSLLKKLGRSLPLREDWDGVKEGLLATLVERKFSAPLLKRKLVSTDPRFIIELNTWGDTTWGMIVRKDGLLIGENRMGGILMDVRERLS